MSRRVLAAEFGGSPINEQNLSNWRQGGYQDWLKQQERRATVRELTKDSKELDADAGGVEASHHLSAVLGGGTRRFRARSAGGDHRPCGTVHQDAGISRYPGACAPAG